MMAEHSKDSPDVMSCPPLVFFGALGAGWLLDRLIPLPSFSGKFAQLAGAALGLSGITLGLWGVHALHRVGTAVRPNHPVTALVTCGPFRYTRNPLYFSLSITYLGISIAWGMLWVMATLVPALAVVHWRIVRREEQFLEAKFGDAYRVYKGRVRRWL